jgi:GTP pyrophosphokinase
MGAIAFGPLPSWNTRGTGQISTRVEPKPDSDQATAALRFARRVHLGQHRKQTHEQFVEHPIAVVRLLENAGFSGMVLVAAYLHDVVEKTPVDLSEISQRFGGEVAEMIDSLSEDPSIAGYTARKRALRAKVLASDRPSVAIYAADRVANMRDWRVAGPEERDQIATRLGTTLADRLALWREDLDELTAYDPKLPFLAEIEIELRALRDEVTA